MKTLRMSRRWYFTLFLLPLWLASSALCGEAALAGLHGVTKQADGSVLPGVNVVVRGAATGDDSAAVSQADGSFSVGGLKAGRYLVAAKKEGFAGPPEVSVHLDEGQNVAVEIPLMKSIAPVATEKKPETAGFLHRFVQAYLDDWHPSAAVQTAAAPAYRGYPPVTDNPPYPFTVWPMGGTVNIGQPNASPYPLTTALLGGPNGDFWKKSGIQLYGWINVGMNISSSKNGPYANAPASYNQIPNSVQLDQATFYIERDPDTVQKDHFDWGFRLTSLYGLDYRFTTSNGVLSNQLLHTNANGSIGNKYGYDPVMAYVDFYFPHVAQGLDLRIGRYVSLPDIEAQLAPNNYTYTHSLLYTYDCYTQDGVNGTFKLSDHWTIQAGLSASCDTAPWTKEAKATVNLCAAYVWQQGRDDIYVCANSINDSDYSYNNLAAYYFTYYHKFSKSRWHTATETWYQYEKHTPNIFNPAAQPLLIINANGAYCGRPEELTCFAPEWAALNYTNRQLGKKDFISFRNEYFDDIKGQRTGFKTRYVEDGISWNHWIGSTLVFRPEIRYEHAFDMSAYDTGTKKTQIMFAGDVIYFF
jgi:putative OmpL-like beta-barrel porin-2/carboxypeptidase family protein